MQLLGTNLQWFWVKADILTYVGRKPPARTSNPLTTPEPVLDADEIIDRIATIQKENLQRLDDDLEILKAYLKSEHAPKVAIEALEGLTVDQQSWKAPIEKVKKGFEVKVRNGRLSWCVRSIGMLLVLGRTAVATSAIALLTYLTLRKIATYVDKRQQKQ